MAEKTEKSVSNTKENIVVESETKIAEEKPKVATAEDKIKNETNEQKESVKPNPKGKEDITLSPADESKNPWKKISKDGI